MVVYLKEQRKFIIRNSSHFFPLVLFLLSGLSSTHWGYIEKVNIEAKKMLKYEEKEIPTDIDYVIYTINRDNENANIFVSRLENGVFVDIQDEKEKNKLDSIVKDMIKKAME